MAGYCAAALLLVSVAPSEANCAPCLPQVDVSPDGSSKDEKHVSQLYTGGAACDVTGATRQTEVRCAVSEG